MAHLRLGDYYADIAGDDTKAAHEIGVAYRLGERLPDREKFFITSQYFSFKAQYEQCRDSLKALTAIYPDESDFRVELASAYYALEQLKEGIQELGHVIRVDPRGARAAGNLVLFLARDNQPDAALAAFDRARSRGVDSPYLYWGRGLALLAKGDVAQARSAFETLGRSAGHYTQLSRLQLARAALHEGNMPDAVKPLRDMIAATQPERDAGMEFVARILLGRAALIAGDKALARAQVSAVRDLTAASDRPTDLRDAGSLALAAGDVGVAKSRLTRLAELESNNPVPIVRSSRLTLQAEMALHDRRAHEALRLADEAGRLRVWYASTIVAARAAEASGDTAGARERWQAVLGVQGQILQDGFPPDLDLARAHLARLPPR
jgi:tetratricopeptide (TPR) repeat protein